MTDSAAYPSCKHGRKIYERCTECEIDMKAGKHGGFERDAAQPAADTIAKSQGFPTSKEQSVRRAAELVMADGSLFLDYLKDAASRDTPMDEWTAGYEECKRRLLTILGPQLERLAVETTAERELFSQVGQLIAGWKQGCTPAEWSDFDEQVLRSWQAWRVAQMPPCPRDDLPSACGERFGPGGHHECRLQPNHDDACKCSCGAIRS